MCQSECDQYQQLDALGTGTVDRPSEGARRHETENGRRVRCLLLPGLR